MNKRNNWQGALENANKSLARYNVSLKVTEEDNCYGLDIVFPDHVENYACGYFEEELEDLIQDVSSDLKFFTKNK